MHALMRRPRLAMLVTIPLAAVVAACTTSPTGRSQLMLVSPQTAIVESKKAYLATVGEIAREDKLAEDPRVVALIRETTGRVISVARELYPNTQDWEWSVAVIDDPDTVNAWCMAGGRMAVYTGLIEQLDLTRDELAHIMGHEAAHAIANHTAEQMSRAMVTSAGITAVGVATDLSSTGLAGAALAAQLALQLPNSRVAESEADQIGMQLAVRAGYEPEAAITLWQKMNSLGGDRPPQFLSTHPSPENRQARLAAMVADVREFAPAQPPPVYPVQVIADVR